jgi:hypothetical protein
MRDHKAQLFYGPLDGTARVIKLSPHAEIGHEVMLNTVTGTVAYMLFAKRGRDVGLVYVPPINFNVTDHS